MTTSNPCGICRDELAGTMRTILPCDHTFHSECITEWLAREPSCPLCRKKCDTGCSVDSMLSEIATTDSVFANIDRVVDRITTDEQALKLISCTHLPIPIHRVVAQLAARKVLTETPLLNYIVFERDTRLAGHVLRTVPDIISGQGLVRLLDRGILNMHDVLCYFIGDPPKMSAVVRSAHINSRWARFLARSGALSEEDIRHLHERGLVKGHTRPVREHEDRLETMTVAKLRQAARQRGLRNYSKLRKHELVSLLQDQSLQGSHHPF